MIFNCWTGYKFGSYMIQLTVYGELARITCNLETPGLQSWLLNIVVTAQQDLMFFRISPFHTRHLKYM